MAGTQSKAVYISSSGRDPYWRSILVSALERFSIEALYDTYATPDDEWKPDLKDMRETARIAILLVSQNFLDSNRVRSEELPHLLHLRNAGRLQLILVLIGQSSWQTLPELREVQMFPEDGIPLQRGMEARTHIQIQELAAKIAEMMKSFGSDSEPPVTVPAPPVLIKAFGAASIALNGNAKLTFTINNPNSNTKLTDIGFIDFLPAGLVVSNPNDLVGSWAEGALIAREGSDVISLEKAVLPARGSCSFQLNVTGISAGIKNNITRNITSRESGNGGTAAASIAVVGVTSKSHPSTEAGTVAEWLTKDTFDRFSAQVRAIIGRAEKIRVERQQQWIHTEDLILSLAAEPRGGLQELLTEVNVNLESIIRGSPTKISDAADVTLEVTALPRISPFVRLALTIARDKADECRSEIIEEEHLLFGVLSVTGHKTVQVLREHGIKPDKVKLTKLREIGPSTHVARDRWTLDDSLGYFPYAYAIYRFLVDNGTQPPLAVSIQAPWGGGKTSMMRMIQAQLDPEASRKLEEWAAPEEPAATVRDVVSELEWTAGNTSDASTASLSTPKVPPMKQPGETRATVWFNAWKYESTSQVWAGLADAIIKQISDRLTWKQRELFWFRLQLRRIDASKVREKIYSEVGSRFIERILPALWKYLLGLGAAVVALLVGWLPDPSRWKYAGPFGAFLIFLGGVWSAVKRWNETKSDVDKQPAKITLGEFVAAPDYGANLGFIHHVVEDLKTALELIPNDDRPVVIFIDDLDRCSPNKVADVIEAINLFLAGEFPYCMFVFGIDDEMVAAALDKAHGDVISRLPAYVKSASIGWRFMDKFVQLPFIVPPPTSIDRGKYAESLLSHDRSGGIDMNVRTQAVRAAEARENSRSPNEVAQEVADKSGLTPKQREELKEEVLVIHQMDRNIKSFSDKEEKIRTLILGATSKFSINPRDVKRFVNVFRFYYFLRAAREARKEPIPSLPQLTRWITLSLKWPGIVRWLRRGHFEADKGAAARLRELENIGNDCEELSKWKEKTALVFGIEAKDATWLADREMMDFFSEEAKMNETDRLSNSSDKGLW